MYLIYVSTHDLKLVSVEQGKKKTKEDVRDVVATESGGRMSHIIETDTCKTAF